MFAVRHLQPLLLPSALSLAACAGSQTNAPTAIHLETNRQAVLVNESARLAVTGENALNDHPRVEWSTTMGRLTPLREGMLNYQSDTPTALFSSSTPGQAVITARLTTDDGRSLSDSVKIAVDPLR